MQRAVAFAGSQGAVVRPAFSAPARPPAGRVSKLHFGPAGAADEQRRAELLRAALRRAPAPAAAGAALPEPGVFPVDAEEAARTAWAGLAHRLARLHITLPDGGQDLVEWSSQPERRAADVARVLAALEPLLAALAALEAAGVVHQDVRPDNVLVSSAGEVRLTDVGHAELAAALPRAVLSGRAPTPVRGPLEAQVAIHLAAGHGAGRPWAELDAPSAVAAWLSRLLGACWRPAHALTAVLLPAVVGFGGPAPALPRYAARRVRRPPDMDLLPVVVPGAAVHLCGNAVAKEAGRVFLGPRAAAAEARQAAAAVATGRPTALAALDVFGVGLLLAALLAEWYRLSLAEAAAASRPAVAMPAWMWHLCGLACRCAAMAARARPTAARALASYRAALRLGPRGLHAVEAPF